MEYKKIIMAVVTLVIIGGVGTLFFLQKNSSTPIRSNTQTVTEIPLPPVDEATLQAQIQNIISRGKEADCDMLSDSRYQLACHDFFKVKAEQATATQVVPVKKK